ncbi:MAG TPA: type II secretion system F family protein [Cellulomonas sp.]
MESAVPLAVSDVLDLLGAAVLAGADVPRALRSVGGVIGGQTGAELDRAAAALVWGASWATAWAPVSPALRTSLSGLETSWTAGTAAAPVLSAAADAERRRRRRAGREAAARLGVRVVLPLGLCFLPAFVLLGLVPVLVSLAGQALG